MNKDRIVGLMKNLSFFIGGITVMVTGLIYVLLTDLYLGNSSTYLLAGVLLAFSGSICFILSNNFKNRKAVFYVLKGIGMAMTIGFIIFLFLFMKTDLYNKVTYLKLFKKSDDKTVWFLSKKFQGAMQIANNIKPVYVINIALSFVAIVCQTINTGFYIITGVEE